MSLIKQIINIKKAIFKKNEDGFFNLLEEKANLIKENEEQEKAILKAEQRVQQTEVSDNNTTQQQISFYDMKELFKDFQKLKPAFNYKNIKTNSFDAMLTGREVYEELGINVYNAGSFSPFVREFVLLSNKIGCFFISMLNLTYQSWMYRQNPLIDKIISYFLIKGFSNIHIEKINDKDEEENNEDENIKKANVLLQKNNQVIFDALLQAEKYGGSYIVINKEDLKNYNKYDLKDKKSNSFTFKDDQEYNKNNVITILGSLKPDNEQDKKLLKGWSFGWFDRYWNDWLYCMKKKAVINEILNKQQMCFVYSDHLKDKNDFNKSGFLAQEIVDKTSSMTNNSVMSCFITASLFFRSVLLVVFVFCLQLRNDSLCPWIATMSHFHKFPNSAMPQFSFQFMIGSNQHLIILLCTCLFETFLIILSCTQLICCTKTLHAFGVLAVQAVWYGSKVVVSVI